MIYAEIKENGRISVFQSTVSDSVEFETIKFEFPESWNGFTKTAVFRGNHIRVYASHNSRRIEYGSYEYDSISNA